MDDELLHKIEAHRNELEINIAKLRNSLHHWTTLELDYEGLKDEFRLLREGATKSDCLSAAHSFRSQKVDEKELNDLVEPSRGKIRSPLQLLEVLSKRIEYVTRNAESLKKQISDLEKKRNAILLAAHPEHEADAALPLAEITEELDENDNILSTNIQRQGDTARKVLDVLENTKLRNAESNPKDTEAPVSSRPRIQGLDSSDDDADDIKIGATIREGRSQYVEAPSLQNPEDYPPNPDDTEEEARLRQEMIQYGLGEVGNIVAELEMADAENVDSEGGDEDIVEHSDDNDEEEEEKSDEYDDDDSTDADSEDETGRSTSAVHTDKYRSHIEELQKQLGFEMANVGPPLKPTSEAELQEQVNYLRESDFNEQIKQLPPEFQKRFGRLSPAEAARKAAIAREEALRNTSKPMGNSSKEPPGRFSSKRKKKQVAFAPTVDIAHESLDENTSTVNDTVMENPVVASESAGSSTPIKVSRFKAGRSSQPQTPTYPPPIGAYQKKSDEPMAPAGRTIAQTLVERPGPTSTVDAPPPDGDDFDEELQRRQIALEHHRLRNRMVHEQGGYVKGGEAENWGEAYSVPEIQDVKTGEPVKVSRFKAARMKP